MAPRVSVVVPAYNSVRFVRATIDSVLAQTFADFELLISDHSSTDGTWAVLQEFADDPRVRLSQLPSGGGAAANWNAVSALATGEYLKLVCSDDLIYPTCVQRQVAALDEFPRAVMATSTRDIVDAAGTPVINARGLPGMRGLIPGREALRRTVRAGSNVFGEPACALFRRAALADAGFWDASYRYLIDEASYARVLLGSGSSEGAGVDLVAIRDPLAGFRVSDQQWSVQLARSQADEARAFHHQLAQQQPGLLSAADLRLGDTRAWVNALGRRATYLALRRRMG